MGWGLQNPLQISRKGERRQYKSHAGSWLWCWEGIGGDKISLSIRTSKKTNFVKQFKAVELCFQDLRFLSLEFLELGFLGKLVCLLQ